ncbi:LCP family protein [Streptomyces sp. UNOC14_S4]|uniref:LCP family protein n=1 Tax=Streptomyces sp. UNOC14_S4 TaxID=2872340 RepID=UPI001E4653CC|nr:LCP family protein [Streptomyces sp. UNOC14_S4]MCC3771095.1 LCP family protein [Streptomyces sp. UNOC14_S4]
MRDRYRSADRTPSRRDNTPGHRDNRGRARAGRPVRAAAAARLAVCLTSAAVMLTSGVGWFAYHWLNNGLITSSALDALRKGAPPKLDDSVNLLLIGLDSRKDMDGNDLPKEFVQQELHAGSSGIGGYNTNTLILMHIPADGGKVTAFSIPRDDYVEVAGGRGEHKIKEAYGLAKAEMQDKLQTEGVKGAELEHRSREAGREATLATVQQFLGVPIDHFAEVNLLGFYDIAKVVQPVQVCLKKPVRDRYSGADFPAGLQELDARQALAFVRQRHGLTGGDLDRTHRQQAFISSVTHKLKSQGVWSDIGKLQGLFDVVKKDVVIDDRWNILDFARQAPNLTGGNAEFHTLPIAGFATRKGEAVNIVDPVKVRSLVQAMIGHQAPSPDEPAAPAQAKNGAPPADAASTTVDVRNASGTPGAAASEAKALAALGYRTGQVSNAPSSRTTSVVYGRGAEAAAQRIAAQHGVRAVADPTLSAGRVVVTLGVGFTTSPPSSVPPPSSPSSSSASAPAAVPSDAFQGDAVKMGGVPCVD